MAGHDVQELAGEVGGIGVVEPDPLDAGQTGHAVHELGYHAFAVEVCAVARQLLCDDLKLLDAFCHQRLDFLQDVLYGAALLPSRDDGYSTVCAVSVAAFAYLEVGVVRGCSEASVVGCLVVIGIAQVGDDLLPVEFSVEAVHLGQFGLQFLEVPLREASHDDELPQLALLLALCQPQNHVDALLLGVGDESAGVHDGDVAAGIFGIVRHAVAAKLQLADELLAVHEVLAAAEGDEVNLH